ncbi:MAG: transketolase C-terminal domain-containing protein [Bacilli bacterium]|nr:transketolase C-terminal domain-containing protein [Bacilli bacterium]
MSNMRDSFFETISDEMKKNANIEFLTGDLGFGVIKPIIANTPDQFTNLGIAEQNLIGMAAGLAHEGKKVFAYSLGNFPTLRPIEQIRNNICYHDKDVKIVSIGGGFTYGQLGMSHHATEDIACLRSLPNMRVFVPCDEFECRAIVHELSKKGDTKPAYLRIERGDDHIHDKPLTNFNLNKFIKVFDGGDTYAILACGTIVSEAVEAAKALVSQGIETTVFSCFCIKPIDKGTIVDLARRCRVIFTLEEHNIIGGLGGAVSEVLAETENRKSRLVRFGLDDVYSSIVGSQKYLREQYDISATKLVSRIIKTIRE